MNRSVWLAAFGLLAISATAWAVDSAEIALPPREKFHLFLLIGQSNMAGRGVVEAQDRVPHPRVLTLTKENQWKPAIDPLHSDKPSAGVGLGSSFARVLAESDPSVTIGLVPCAVGGSPLARWQKGGDLWQQAIERCQFAQRVGTLRGVLWHQGESDSSSLSTAESYASRLAQMVRDLRVELAAPDVPFVAGRLGEFLLENNKTKQKLHWRLVNAQLDQLPQLVPRTAVVDSVGLNHKGDDLHFDSASLREFGRRYATAWKKLQQP